MVKSNLALALPVQLHIHAVWCEHTYAWGEQIYAGGEHIPRDVFRGTYMYIRGKHISVTPAPRTNQVQERLNNPRLGKPGLRENASAFAIEERQNN